MAKFLKHFIINSELRKVLQLLTPEMHYCVKKVELNRITSTDAI